QFDDLDRDFRQRRDLRNRADRFVDDGELLGIGTRGGSSGGCLAHAKTPENRPLGRPKGTNHGRLSAVIVPFGGSLQRKKPPNACRNLCTSPTGVSLIV